jgi:hypothetical protein
MLGSLNSIQLSHFVLFDVEAATGKFKGKSQEVHQLFKNLLFNNNVHIENT